MAKLFWNFARPGHTGWLIFGTNAKNISAVSDMISDKNLHFENQNWKELLLLFKSWDNLGLFKKVYSQ